MTRAYKIVSALALSIAVGAVIVAAAGREKANIVLECLRRGLINQLLIDDDLARALVNKAGTAR